MQGYTVMLIETLEQLRAARAGRLTHVFVQGGVGGLAAAVTAHLWEDAGSAAPIVTVVEPEKADCLFQSALAGRPRPASGDLSTIMAGLSCGEVSIEAWRVLGVGARFFITIEDAPAIAAMRLLAQRGAAGESITAGESATAGLAALLAASADADLRRTLGLDTNSNILLIGSEGATDPALYRELVGEPALG
jgi:diaminopropionate ammonia-lyase